MSKEINFRREEIEHTIHALEIVEEECGLTEIQEKILNRLKRSLKPIKSASRKAKGRELQKKICIDISELLNISYDQKDDQCLIHSREMGQNGVDVILRGAALKKFPFSIECKNSETFNFTHTIKQAERNEINGTKWMIIYKKKSFNNPIIIMDWNKFLTLLRKNNE